MILKQIWPELEGSSRHHLSRGVLTRIAMHWTCWEYHNREDNFIPRQWQASSKSSDVSRPIVYAGGSESLLQFSGWEQFLLLLTFKLLQHLKWTIPLKNDCSFVSALIFLFTGETYWIAIFIGYPQSWCRIGEKGPDWESKNITYDVVYLLTGHVTLSTYQNQFSYL